MPNEIRYCDYYDRERSDPAFYTWNESEWVATHEFEGRAIEVWCVGEMRINLPNGNVIRYADDLRDNGINSNEDLYNLTKDDDAFDIWENNSWLEIRDYEGEWIGDFFSGHIYHDVEEALDACAELLQDPEFLAEYPCLIPANVVE